VSWRTQTQRALAIVSCVGRFNSERLCESLDDLPPAELEALHVLRYAAATHQGQDDPAENPPPSNPDRRKPRQEPH